MYLLSTPPPSLGILFDLNVHKMAANIQFIIVWIQIHLLNSFIDTELYMSFMLRFVLLMNVCTT